MRIGELLTSSLDYTRASDTARLDAEVRKCTMTKALALLTVALIVSPVLAAQTPSSKKPSGAKKLLAEKAPPKAPLYALAPVDQATDKLGPSYAGHSCRALAKALLAAKPLKDEYETTAAWTERLAGLKDRPLVGTATANDYFGFVPVESYVGSKYNADTGTLEIFGRDRSINVMAGKSLQQTLVINTDLASESHYPASNAYGKQVEVLKTEHNVCAIAATSIPSFEDPIKFQASIAMSPDDAMAAKGAIETLYVGKLTAPYWGKYFHATTAKITSPFEDYSTGDALFMNVSEVWLFNKVSGRIYQKIKISG